jgi:SAM-dependent methyltransferase
MRGKLILDAGCGAGRFADVAASHGARVVACDLSRAADACREVTRIHEGAVQAVQASIYALPLRPQVFDALYCFGVIQHTPEPNRTMQVLPSLLKPGGMLAYDFYQRTNWEKPFIPHWAFRRFTPSWPAQRTLLFAQILTAAFFPVSAVMARLPVFSNYTTVLPIATIYNRELSLEQQYLWTLLDTFDWYGPKFEQRQDFREVSRLLSQLGLQDIVARPGVVTARAPGQERGGLRSD